MNNKATNLKNKLLRFIKFLAFTAIAVVLYLSLERIVKPTWNYPGNLENISFNLEGFYAQKEQSDQVLFLGTSHMVYGISPLEIYRNNGLSGYNLGTSAQRVSGSYYLLKEAFKTQRPEVVVLDVSSLFLEETNDAAWRYILDNMPSLISKIPMALAYAGMDEIRNEGDFAQRQEMLTSALFPMYRYHVRWDSLSHVDFRDFKKTGAYYAAGYTLSTAVQTTGQTVETMNETAEGLARDRTRKTVTYKDGDRVVTKEEAPLYAPAATEENLKWLDRLQELCRENDAELLLTKIPSIRFPNQYDSAWTRIRSSYMKDLAKSRGLDFYDQVYDEDLDININEDFMDGGGHLNYLGARKASAAMGDYLAEHYGIAGSPNEAFDEKLQVYDRLLPVARIELEKDLPAYLERLYEMRDDITVIIAGKDEMTSGLDEKDISALQKLGLQAAYKKSPGFRDSYIAVIVSGKVAYEASSNRELEYEKKLKGKRMLKVVSEGWKTGSETSIKIDDREYCAKGVGINIVVYDNATRKVIDSASFNTYEPAPHACTHELPQTKFEEYWLKIAKVES